jgi:3-phenylpropionate/cinnamic acid dioxygenase small subunit
MTVLDERTVVEERRPTPVPMTSPLYAEVMAWLFEEADLLDRNDFYAWLERLAPDLHYTMPVRSTVRRADGAGISTTNHHFDDTLGSLTIRARRFLEATEWAEDPPSRTRRFVTNIRVQDPGGDELSAQSYLLVLRSRLDAPTFEFICCERRDVFRRTEEGLRLSRREIIVDQSNLGTVNLALFF